MRQSNAARSIGEMLAMTTKTLIGPGNPRTLRTGEKATVTRGGVIVVAKGGMAVAENGSTFDVQEGGMVLAQHGSTGRARAGSVVWACYGTFVTADAGSNVYPFGDPNTEPPAGSVKLTFGDLDKTERALVRLAWRGADYAWCPYSQFPVGAGMLMENARGRSRRIRGCNIENASYGGTVCAERTGIFAGVKDGYRKLRVLAVVCKKNPGGAPCGFCRQVLREFGFGPKHDAVVYNIFNTNGDVVRWTVGQLLPDSFGPDTVLPGGLPELPIPPRGWKPANERVARGKRTT